jgi:hypothetical protein
MERTNSNYRPSRPSRTERCDPSPTPVIVWEKRNRDRRKANLDVTRGRGALIFPPNSHSCSSGFTGCPPFLRVPNRQHHPLVPGRLLLLCLLYRPDLSRQYNIDSRRHQEGASTIFQSVGHHLTLKIRQYAECETCPACSAMSMSFGMGTVSRASPSLSFALTSTPRDRETVLRTCMR